MGNKPTLNLLVGISGSGKSTLAKKLEKEGAIWISSDNIRKELYGSCKAEDMDKNIVFLTMQRRAIAALREGKDIVIDSTNISQRRRISCLKFLSKGCKEGFHKICYYVDTDLKTAIERQKQRIEDEQVPIGSLKRQINALTKPEYFEGWDEIRIKQGDRIIVKDKPIINFEQENERNDIER